MGDKAHGELPQPLQGSSAAHQDGAGSDALPRQGPSAAHQDGAGLDALPRQGPSEAHQDGAGSDALPRQGPSAADRAGSGLVVLPQQGSGSGLVVLPQQGAGSGLVVLPQQGAGSGLVVLPQQGPSAAHRAGSGLVMLPQQGPSAAQRARSGLIVLPQPGAGSGLVVLPQQGAGSGLVMLTRQGPNAAHRAGAGLDAPPGWPEQLARWEEDPDEATIVERMDNMLRELCRGGHVEFYRTLLDPTSFERSVRNVYLIAILASEGRFNVFKDEANVPTVIRPRTRGANNDPEQGMAIGYEHFVVTLTMNNWARMIAEMGITEPVLKLYED